MCLDLFSLTFASTIIKEVLQNNRSGKLRELFRFLAKIYDWELKTLRQHLHFKLISCCWCNLSRVLTTMKRSTTRKHISLAKELSHCPITIHCTSFLSEFVKDLPLVHTLCTLRKSYCKETCKATTLLCLSYIYTEEKTNYSCERRVCSPQRFGVKLPPITSRHVGKDPGFAGLLKTSKRAAW